MEGGGNIIMDRVNSVRDIDYKRVDHFYRVNNQLFKSNLYMKKNAI